MTLFAPSAPLVTIAHDWAAPVERATTFPSRVLTHWDGSEQRQSLSHVGTDRITYRAIAPTAVDAVSLNLLARLATNALIRIPRWEDQTRVDTAVVATATNVPCDTVDRPAFVDGAEVIIWRSPSSYEVGVLDTVNADSIDLVDPLANDWGAGSIVAPISEARLILPLGMSHWAPTSGIPELTVEVALRDLAGLGSGGTAVAGVPYAIAVSEAHAATFGGRDFVVAVVTDVAGNVLSPDAIVWTSNDPTNCPVYATSEPGVAIVSNPTPIMFTSRLAIATIGAVSGSGVVWMDS